MNSETTHIDDTNIDELMQKGINYYKARRCDEALNIYEEILNIDDEYVDALVEKGNCLRKLQESVKSFV